MASFVRFECFSEDLAKKVHNLHSDTLKVYLSNATPNVATHTVKSDIAEISTGNGYTAGGHDTQNTITRSGLVSTVTATDITITASGSSVGPFRYAILYNDDSTSDSLIGYWDYGSAITLAVGEPLLVDFTTSSLTIG